MPLQAHDIDDDDLTFEAADPVLSTLTGLLKAAIEAELGTTDGSWAKVCAAVPSGHRLSGSTAPVGSVWRMAPTAQAIRQIGVTWPLLCVWREGNGEVEQQTMMKSRYRQRWMALWSLGDIEDDLGLKLGGALTYVARVMATTIDRARHPAYDSGTLQFGSGRGDLQGIRPIEIQAGRQVFPDDEESKFWGCSVTFETLEEVVDLDEGADDFTGTLSASVGNELELIPDLVQGDPDYPGV